MFERTNHILVRVGWRKLSRTILNLEDEPHEALARATRFPAKPPGPESLPMLPSNRIPVALKLAYTAFMVILVPTYWREYGPTNFLYFCDVALFFALGAVWLESPLLASMPAVGILLPQMLWCVDFLGSCIGMRVMGMTEYMFDPSKSLFLRRLSFFHFWLPFLLVYIVWRLGYDRRALLGWTALAWLLQLVGYFLLPAGPAPTDNRNLPVNVNYVFGFDDKTPQTWMPGGWFLVLMMTALPLLLFLPTHFLLAWLAGPPRPKLRPA